MCLSVSTFSFAHFRFAVWWNLWLNRVCSSWLALLKLIAFNKISCERLCESMIHAFSNCPLAWHRGVNNKSCRLHFVNLIHFYLRALGFLGHLKKIDWKWIVNLTKVKQFMKSPTNRTQKENIQKSNYSKCYPATFEIIQEFCVWFYVSCVTPKFSI